MFGPGQDPGEGAAALLERLGLGHGLSHRVEQLARSASSSASRWRAPWRAAGLVLADEPTGNLDPRFALEALEMLRILCRDTGAALYCASHDPRVLDAFERRVRFADVNVAMQREEEKRVTSLFFIVRRSRACGWSSTVITVIAAGLASAARDERLQRLRAVPQRVHRRRHRL